MLTFRQWMLACRCVLDELDRQVILESRQPERLDSLKPILVNQGIKQPPILFENVCQLQVQRFFGQPLGLRCAATSIKQKDLFQESRIDRIVFCESLSNLHQRKWLA